MKDISETTEEHRFRTLNTLTVNEKTTENEIVSLQHYSLSCIDTFHFSLSPTGKIAVSFAKRSSSSYKQTFTKFSREKSLSQFHFSIFKLPLQSASFSPQTHEFSVSQTLHILVFCLHAIMNPLGD